MRTGKWACGLEENSPKMGSSPDRMSTSSCFTPPGLNLLLRITSSHRNLPRSAASCCHGLVNTWGGVSLAAVPRLVARSCSSGQKAACTPAVVRPGRPHHFTSRLYSRLLSLTLPVHHTGRDGACHVRLQVLQLADGLVEHCS